MYKLSILSLAALAFSEELTTVVQTTIMATEDASSWDDMDTPDASSTSSVLLPHTVASNLGGTMDTMSEATASATMASGTMAVEANGASAAKVGGLLAAAAAMLI